MSTIFKWPDARPRYYVDGDTVYEHSTGKPAFYLHEGAAYTFDGKPAYWTSSRYLHGYDGGCPSLYFGED
jgi:hypothetical protein